ncbi:unnamed protein product [Rhizophagus irregularis]|nr:unnamed protein product [Rhizophagus irregularis]
MKVYVKNVSAAASVYDVIRALSGYDALFAPPECMGKPFSVSKHAKKPKKKRKNYASFDEVKFTLSGLEMGNWGGRSSIISPNSDDNPSPKPFTFLSESEICENPTICFSKAEKAYLLEGFRAFDETKRVRISYRTLLEDPYGIFLDEKDGVISLYISLKHPPLLYRQDKRWIRTTDWTRINDNIFEDIFGRCLVYKLIFRNDIDLDELRDEIANLRLISPPESKSIVRCIDKSSNYPIEYFENIIHKLPFRLYYKLACLVSHGILSLYEIEENRLDERLKNLISGTYSNIQNNNQNLEVTVWYALNQITMKDWNPFNVERQNRPITDFEPAIKNFKGDFNDWHPSNPNFPLENNFRSVWVNHATITPTKIYFDEPNYEASNRILRLYKEKIDRFLRVTFKEENFDKLFVNEEDDLDITDRIVDILKKGFYLAERHYEFLAFSSSQLRDQSCWFVASDGDFNANYIRSMMGDFSEIKGPALYAARMGQCFTSTIGTLQPEHVQYIDDIKNRDYVFSDGCGKISPSLAARAAKEHLGTKISDNDEIPSVFQIRFGGCKGMVAVDPTLKGDVLCIRPSQRKFKAPDPLYLEIVKTVKTSSPGYLNRQIILLLSTLGVPDDVFIPLQNQMRDDINSIMTDENNAREICKRNMGTRETSHIKSTIISMINAGMMQGNIDPFLKAILECKRVYTLKSLKYKARILMPNSFLLLGVIDETGILEEDEIYVQTSTIVSEQQTSKSKDWIPAIIARNPCLHPGDIRNVKVVVNVKELSHLKNCVVFSQKGNRPLPNMLAGGDLDGDEFFVCFDKRIFIPRNEEPMVYDSQGKEDLKRPVVMDDIYSNSKGVKSTGCIVLAELHSQAVDFNKTGIPVKTKLPNIDENPDFMEVKCKPSYKSEKILGKLYRNIKLHEYESDPILKYKEHKITVNDDFIFDGYQKRMDKEAIVIRNFYNGIKQMEGRKNQHKRDVISEEVSKIINRYRKQFLNGIQDDTNNDNNNTNHGIKPIKIPINEKSKAKASAWYHVTYDHPEKDNMALPPLDANITN